MNLIFESPIKFFIYTVFIWININALAVADPSDINLASLKELISEIRAASINISFTCDVKTEFLEDNEVISDCVNAQSSFEGELLARGRFVASFQPYANPWKGGESRVYGENKKIAFDGEKYISLVLACGPVDNLQEIKTAKIESEQIWIESEMEKMLGLQAFFGIGRIFGLGGSDTDIANWENAFPEIIQVKWLQKENILRISLRDINPKFKKQVPAEVFDVLIFPKIGIKKYSNFTRNENGDVIGGYEIETLEFDASVPGGIMFPKKAKSILKMPGGKNREKFERRTEITYKNIKFIPSSKVNYQLKIPQGALVKDERLKIEFQMSDDAGQIIQSLQEIDGN